MTRRRIITRVIVLVLLGAVINVAVAWACAVWVPLRATNDIWLRAVTTNEPPLYDCLVTKRFGSLRVEGTWFVEEGEPWGPFDEETFPGIEPNEIPQLLIPSWCPLHEHAGHELDQHDYDARGWPLLSFWCEFPAEPTVYPGEKVARGGIDLRLRRPALPSGGGWGMSGAPSIPPTMPLRPIWPGFAFNTIIYAAILWGGLWLVFCAGPGFVRRRIRLGRGQCLHCGYDLRGQPFPEIGQSKKCPECGRSA